MDEPRFAVLRKGDVPREQYGMAEIHWLTSQAVNGARELTLGETTLQPGGSNPLHRHPNCEEVLYVLSGEIEQVIAGDRVAMRAGDTILIPRNRPHRAFNVGQTPAVMLVAFSSAQRETVLIPEE